MHEESVAIDISGMPDVVSLAEEVRASGRARVLRCEGRDVAMVIPVPVRAARPGRRPKTAADFAAFRSSAGGWSDVDTDAFIAADRESRSRSLRDQA